MRNEDHFVLYKHGNGYWYYYVYRYGKRVYRTTGEKNKARALAETLKRRDRGDLLNELQHTKFQRFKDFAAPFWIWETCPVIRDKVERGGHFSRLLADTNRRCTQKYLIPAFGNKLLPEITTTLIKPWHRGLPAKYGISPQTANKVLSILRKMLDVAVAEGALKTNAARLVKPLFPQEKARGCFTLEQVRALFAQPWKNKYMEAACKLAALTGMRLGEIRGLCFEQIHPAYIEVDRAYAELEGVKSTKSGVKRKVPIPQEMFEMLQSFPLKGGLIFTLDGEKPIDTTSFGYALKQRMEACGIDWKAENLTFHSFRHFFNTQLVAQGVDQNYILAIVGHSSIRMTQHYLHLEAEDMKQIRDVQSAI